MSCIYIVIIFVFLNWNSTFSCPNLCACKKNKQIICQSKSFVDIPLDIPKDVVYLDLSSNNINDLKVNSFNGFHSLKKLILNNNNMKSINENAFKDLPLLKDLQLLHNDLSEMNPEIFNNKNLNQLLHVNLGYNQFLSIPILKVTQMTKLNLDSNRIKSAYFNKPFLLNTGLQTIVLTKNFITNIEENDFLNLKNSQLLTLNLKLNQLQSIHPEAFKPIKNSLQNLELDGNKLLNSTVIESAFKGFNGGGSQMHYIDIKNCGLTSISAEFFSPFSNSKLHRLDISNNAQLSSIDKTAFNTLINLQYLLIKNCKISSPEIQFSALVNLRQLYLNKNNFQKCPYRLPGSIELINLESNDIRKIYKHDFKSLTNLKYLNLKSNSIVSIEILSFSDLIKLETLDLSFNRLTVINKDVFVGMTNLMSLDLSTQKPCIEKINDNLLKLSSLTSLILNGNCIKFEELSNSPFGNIKQLTNLSLQDNHLEYLNDKLFANCNNLKMLDLSHNKLKRWTARTFDRIKSTIVSLQLAFNKISNLSIDIDNENYLPQFKNLNSISLDNNEWNCTCQHVHWLIQYRKMISNNKLLICNYPREKIGLKLLEEMNNCTIDTINHNNAIISQFSNKYIKTVIITFIVIIIIICGLLYRYRRNIKSKLRHLKTNGNSYSSILASNTMINGYSNEYLVDDELIIQDHTSINRLAFNDDFNEPVPTWQYTVIHADRVVDDVDIVLLSLEPIIITSSTITIKQIHNLSDDQSKIIVYQSDKLAINYPLFDVDILYKLLQLRNDQNKKLYNIILMENNDQESQYDPIPFQYEKPIEFYNDVTMLSDILIRRT